MELHAPDQLFLAAAKSIFPGQPNLIKARPRRRGATGLGQVGGRPQEILATAKECGIQHLDENRGSPTFLRLVPSLARQRPAHN